MDKFNDGYTLPGSIGHLMVLITVLSAIVATFSYYKATVTTSAADKLPWRNLARYSFYVQFFSIVSIVICLYYILYNHQYQYKFAYKHSDNSLPVKYLFSCFWEGQEGSFLLWLFWHNVLGLFLMHSAKSWEAPVMTVLSFVQIFLAAFLVGIYFGDFHIGSSPFVLLRNSDMGIGPIFSQPNYLSLIKDGNGLNKTLLDPWMVIHPPTLFFGYASCTIPMAWAVAALWRKDYTGWVKPSLPWTVLAACMLGVGILMGAKWAYQSLSFGGYWAWDPVENASLVPWLLLIAGMHTKLIYKHSGYSLRASFVLIILTFVFVIYSTCLTRTGILGETSVHAFTGGGLVSQIWLFLPFVCLAPLVLLVLNYTKIPTIVKEEATWSREFFMFIGALVFTLSGIFIIAATSLPVVNKLFGLKYALGENNQAIYNNVHVPIVVIIAILLGVTQFLKYKNTTRVQLRSKLLWPLVITAVITIIFILVEGISYAKQGEGFRWLLILATAASIFTVVANAGYIAQVTRTKWLSWGSPLAHVGFGLLLVGILISASNQKIVSMNRPAVNVFAAESKEDPRENLVLFKDEKMNMGKYSMQYLRSEKDKISTDKMRYYVSFTDTLTNNTFTLNPTAYLNVMQNGKKQIQPNPDFVSYYNKDLFLYITSLINPDELAKPSEYEQKPMNLGDTGMLKNGYFVVKNIINTSGNAVSKPTDNISFKAAIEVIDATGKRSTVYPSYNVVNNTANSVSDSIVAQKLQFRIDGLSSSQQLLVSVKDESKITDYIAIKVLEFPQIKLMWIGIIVMSIGFMLSLYKRVKKLNAEAKRSI